MRNYKIVGLVIAAVVITLMLTEWGRLALFAVVGSAMLPVWALFLSSIILMICVALGSAIVALSNVMTQRRETAQVVTQPVVVTENLGVVEEEIVEQPRKAA